MVQKIIIQHNSYYDSVTLMQISEQAKSFPGVSDAVVAMGTDSNKQFLEDIGFVNDEIKSTGVNDLLIAIRAEDDAVLEAVSKFIKKLLTQKDFKEKDASMVKSVSLDYELRQNPDANIVLISIPGKFAHLEAKKALINGKHVMLFSDNVDIKYEVELKDLALRKGLLLMGPDCGTAIINNVPLGFANVVPKGPIGIVAASGTGSQQVSSLIARMGSGITHLIGTGGRDLSEMVGGKMMLFGIELLKNDSFTKVIVLISKPPAQSVMEKVLISASKCSKPVVVCFLGGKVELIEKYNLISANNLEDTASKAVQLANVNFSGMRIDDSELERIAEDETARMRKDQKYIRGLYSGGTLADEAIIHLQNICGGVYSNTPIDPACKLPSGNISVNDTIIDLGDDEFTKGRAHPMIDPTYRQKRLMIEASDSSVAVILLDIVLGYGSHPDPAGALLESIMKAKKTFVEKGSYLSVIASVCGTENDPQVLSKQEEKLKSIGVICMPSNFQAVKLAGLIKKKRLQCS